ncbi:MAG: hypothetical protein AAGC60_23550 [Acidobacteriota bacterium]
MSRDTANGRAPTVFLGGYWMTLKSDDDETTILDDPIESATESAWPDALGLCAGGVEHWIRRLERLRAHGNLPPDVADGVAQTLDGFLRPAATALTWLAEARTAEALAMESVADA